MKTLVLFYSYSGKTRKLAREFAGMEAADIAEIRDKKRPVKLKVVTLGIISSIRGKAWPILPLNVDWKSFDSVQIFSPVWAGNPPPAVNAALAELSGGKNVSFTMVSASGKSECKSRLESIIAARGCSLESFSDVKA